VGREWDGYRRYKFGRGKVGGFPSKMKGWTHLGVAVMWAWSYVTVTTNQSIKTVFVPILLTDNMQSTGTVSWLRVYNGRTFSCLLQNAADIFDDLSNKRHKQGLEFGCKAITKSIECQSTIHSSCVIITTSRSIQLYNKQTTSAVNNSVSYYRETT